MNDDPLLTVRDLKTQFHTDDGTVYAVDGVSFSVDHGETVCIVGESGSGKSVTSESITRLIPIPPGELVDGTVEFDGMDLTEMTDKQLQQVRGNRISHVFQNPQGALNPVYTVGTQISEAIRIHENLSKKKARERAIDLLDRVGIPEAGQRVDDYPHEFSGGMKQRVVIAMALSCQPDLLIADEPTTALDVTIQAQILDLLRDLQEEYGMSIIFVTHDLGVVAEIADSVVVMYAGKVMERGDVFDIFEEPAHPYTRALLRCRPGQGDAREAIRGQLPSMLDPPDGCRFAPRCPHAVDDCEIGDQPPLLSASGDGDLTEIGEGSDATSTLDGHHVSCIYYQEGYDESALDAATEGSPSVGDARTDGGSR